MYEDCPTTQRALLLSGIAMSIWMGEADVCGLHVLASVYRAPTIRLHFGAALDRSFNLEHGKAHSVRGEQHPQFLPTDTSPRRNFRTSTRAIFLTSLSSSVPLAPALLDFTPCSHPGRFLVAG